MRLLGHPLGERGDEDALVALGAALDLLEQVVDLALGRLDDDLRVDEAGGADDLLDDAVGDAHLVAAGGRGEVDRLADALLELLPLERTVVHRRGQAEAVLDERALAGGVALVHRADLRHGHVRLVDHDEEVVGEVVEEAVRRLARLAAVDVPGVVLDARAESDLLHHLEVERGAHPEPLGLEQLALLLEIGEPHLELLLDRVDRAVHDVLAGDVVRTGEDGDGVELAHDVAGERVQGVQRLDLVPEHLDADREAPRTSG